MKKLNLLLVGAMLISLTLSSCKKSAKVSPTGALGSSYPEVLNSIVTPQMISTLRSDGLTINEGTTPPMVSGIFHLAPDLCIYDNSAANAGKLFANYNYQFLNQDNTKFAVTINYASADGTDTGSDASATYISGNGQLFTVFAQVTGTLSGVTYKELQVLSGELNSGFIKNFQWSFYMVSKTSDPGDKAVVPVGTVRIFKDEDGTSESTTTLNPASQNLVITALQTGLKPASASVIR